MIETDESASLRGRGDVLNNAVSCIPSVSAGKWKSARALPMLTVEALPADCKPLKINSTGKFGEKLSPMLAMIYVKKE